MLLSGYQLKVLQDADEHCSRTLILCLIGGLQVAHHSCQYASAEAKLVIYSGLGGSSKVKDTMKTNNPIICY